MNKQRIFVTGTDTDVGKTFVTKALVDYFQQQKLSVVAIKPIAAGCSKIDGQLRNDDALQLIDSMRQIKSTRNQYRYETINPISLAPPIAPHIAAKEGNIDLNVDSLSSACNLKQFEEDVLLIEGAGGWLVPLNETQSMADWVQSENLSVILVVGVKLGCINHALLTIQNMKTRGVNIIGWVANCLDQRMLNRDENIDTLRQIIDVPLLSIIPFTCSELEQSFDSPIVFNIIDLSSDEY